MRFKCSALHRLCTLVVLLVSMIFPRLLAGQAHFEIEFNSDAGVHFTYPSGRSPFVHSFAKATLFNSRNERIYNAQVILGHRVADTTTNELRYNAQIVTEIGLANSSTGDLPAEYGHCYQAAMAAHANAYSQHYSLLDLEKCIPELPVIEIPSENCPVLLDLDQDGFHLSGASPAVVFDINADSVPNRIAWTRAGEDDAFLCMDRNHNGIIDNGSELFGYATPLLSGEPAKIGYVALAELDKPETGGNGDGRVDSRDMLFQDLCAWVDANRDGISQPGEIYSLDQVGVAYLDYAYRTTRLRDSYGNMFRYVSSVGMRTAGGVVRAWPTFDVIFASP